MTYVVINGSITTNNMNKILQIQISGSRVFTAQDLAVWWGYSDEDKLYELIKYYVRTGQIYKFTRGLYSLIKYNQQSIRQDTNLLYEVANKLIPNSYVSLWTVLKREGVVFQYYDEIYSMARKSVTRDVLGVKFVYKQIKQNVLLNDLGVEEVGKARLAGVERAIGDAIYYFANLALERIGDARQELLYKVAKIYQNRTLEIKVKQLWEENNVGSK